jgi:hypothetical protein
VIEADVARLLGGFHNRQFGAKPKLDYVIDLRGGLGDSAGVSNLRQAVEDGLTLRPSAL